MPIFKMPNCLPQSAPGNTEYHFGYLCQVREDGIYIDLKDPATIANFKAAGRIVGVIEDSTAKVETPDSVKVEKEPVQDKPQTIADVVENGSGKRPGRPAKDK